MSRYTITLKKIIDLGIDIGLKDYPIFSEEYREHLNSMIIQHFYFREIGLETPAKFAFFMKRKMNEIMWRYNKLYEIRMTEFNPLYNIEIHETLKQKSSNSSESTSNDSLHNNLEASSNDSSTSNNNSIENNLNYNSNFPVSIKPNEFNENYIENASKENSTQNVNSTNSNNSRSVSSNYSSSDSNNKAKASGTNEYEKVTQGSSAGLPFSKALEQFKDFTICYDLDMQVISELEELFMSVY